LTWFTFGLVMVLNLMIGLLHPPMGMVLFVWPALPNFPLSGRPLPSCPGWFRFWAHSGHHLLSFFGVVVAECFIGCWLVEPAQTFCCVASLDMTAIHPF
jgi:hypothetical protein